MANRPITEPGRKEYDAHAAFNTKSRPTAHGYVKRDCERGRTHFTRVSRQHESESTEPPDATRTISTTNANKSAPHDSCVKRDCEIWLQQTRVHGNRRLRRSKLGNDSVGRDGLRDEMGRPVVRPRRRLLSSDAVLPSAAARGKFKYAAKPVRRQDDFSTTSRCVERVARVPLAVADKSTTIPHGNRSHGRRHHQSALTGHAQSARAPQIRGAQLTPARRDWRLAREMGDCHTKASPLHFPAYHDVKACDRIRRGGGAATENGYGILNLAVQAPPLSLRRPPQHSTSTTRHGVRPSEPRSGRAGIRMD
ncbi:hypothetical protein D9611_011394 [Ephemerocybe angulata]|uniref:Uncharacterized protein n=1 Tax=Ephemerocybe angulata TaxID=980116 RepID=A0A8H5F1P8_9AGAR|nr:hypothetical protein D9611_011394 [Tulosesus angulatus]